MTKSQLNVLPEKFPVHPVLPAALLHQAPPETEARTELSIVTRTGHPGGSLAAPSLQAPQVTKVWTELGTVCS